MLAILGLLLGAALAVRFQERPELRKASPMTPSAAMQAATRAAVEHDTQGKGGIISKHAPARLVALPTDWRTFSPGTLWVVVLLALVATALGMPKRKRWAQLGGHGRHGAG